MADRKMYFSLEKRQDRWWLVTPDGTPFWSIGINHIDSAALRGAESQGVWIDRYDNSIEQWLRTAVKPDLLRWGFNTVGWVQEVVVINDQHHRHSRSFTCEEYRWLDMPYCHLLPFIESHQWEDETRLPDIRSEGFSEWCDYVARDQCARLRDDPNLIGYFFTDCPTWVHNRPGNRWKAPIFDPDMLSSASGRTELEELATIYYRTLTDAIRRYDPNHLILGDRYEAQAPLPEEVVRAALPYVDILSFQCFADAETITEHLTRWARFSGKPVLLADSALFAQPHTPGWPAAEDRHQDAGAYRDVHRKLRELPECVGYHLCGAYIRNNTRRYGMKDRLDRDDTSALEISEVNRETADWTALVSNDPFLSS